MPGSRPLLSHLVEFVRVLQGAGVEVGPGRLIELCRAFNFIDFTSRADFYAAALATLVSRREDVDRFRNVFSAFWEQYGAAQSMQPRRSDDEEDEGTDGEEGSAGQRGQSEAALPAVPDDPAEGENGDQDEILSWSDREAIVHKDIGSMSPEELDHARRAIAAIVKSMAAVRGRRFSASRTGTEPDFRRMFRRNAASGGELPRMSYRRRRERKTRLLLLCDVSGSMERYSRFLIQFVYALRRELPRVDVGVFSTSLVMITDVLDSRNVDESLKQVSAMAGNWGSGTDIGGSLRQFNEQHARRVVRSGTVLVILSDGWDRGDAQVMQAQFEQLHRRVRSVIWLNPLLGHANYEPLCRGIRIALPYVDHFLPAHNLASLRQLSRSLRGS